MEFKGWEAAFIRNRLLTGREEAGGAFPVSCLSTLSCLE